MTEARAVRGRPLYAAAMIAGGMALIGFIDNFVRVIADHAGLWQFHLLRSAIAAPAILAVALALGARLRPRRWRAALARTGFLSGAMLLYFAALPTTPIAVVGAGLFTSPVFVLVFSALFFGAPVGPRRIAAVGAAFLGAMLLLRPWEAGFTPWALTPIAAGALYAMAVLTARRWCADEPPLTLVLMFFVALGLAGALGLAALPLWPAGPELVEAAPFFFSGWRWPLAGEGLFWIAAQALVSILAVFMTTSGYQSAESSQVTLFDYTFLVSASLWAWLLWGEVVSAAGFAGMGLIAGAGIFLALRMAPVEAVDPARGPAR